MTRTTLALTVVLLASFTSGCGRYYYRHRVMYAVPVEPVEEVVGVETGYSPPPPPAPRPPPPPPPAPRPRAAAPRQIIVHAPPGSVVIVTPGRPTVVRKQAPVAPVEPAEPEAPPPPPAAPAEPTEPDEGWFNGR